jgi:hypothetical protein
VTELERAEQYIGIFVGVGDRWPEYVPVDGVRTPAGVRIGSVEVFPDPARSGVWLADDGARVRTYRAA